MWLCMARIRWVLRSRHIACLVTGSSKKAGTGNCWAAAAVRGGEAAQDLARVQESRGAGVAGAVELDERRAVHRSRNEVPAHRRRGRAPRDPDRQIACTTSWRAWAAATATRWSRSTSLASSGTGHHVRDDAESIVQPLAREAAALRTAIGCGCRRCRSPARAREGARRSNATSCSSRAMASMVRSCT